jgi:hypothetical protein
MVRQVIVPHTIGGDRNGRWCGRRLILIVVEVHGCIHDALDARSWIRTAFGLGSGFDAFLQGLHGRVLPHRRRLRHGVDRMDRLSASTAPAGMCFDWGCQCLALMTLSDLVHAQSVQSLEFKVGRFVSEFDEAFETRRRAGLLVLHTPRDAFWCCSRCGSEIG